VSSAPPVRALRVLLCRVTPGDMKKLSASFEIEKIDMPRCFGAGAFFHAGGFFFGNVVTKGSY
jgi:hypothetical protein